MQDKEQKYRINMIALLVDILDQYLTELKPEYRQGMKQMINNSLTSTRRFIREIDRIMNDQNKENFGFTAEDIRELLDSVYLHNCQVRYEEIE